MAPLSKNTAGIILPFDTFGTHLSKSNKTVDMDLEKKNFEAAGEILTSVWSESVIDLHPFSQSSVLWDAKASLLIPTRFGSTDMCNNQSISCRL